ncbi:RHS repeat-associated protein [Mucilaginibacter gracilis]|uniref:RHS repeat-associated protein n=1 Tax=Mucilaginibacter gracilis TaxID=423350 RepID=A0A495J1L5_9SPHI|nr:hypothetical protein [Mucilaginibacter gracilis]RKR82855.1 RHS repeat-associated protein [Mucilaginibacter gracilis]
MKKLLITLGILIANLVICYGQDNPYKIFGYKPKVDYKDNPLDIYQVKNADPKSKIRYLTLDRQNKVIKLIGDRDSLIKTITYTDEDLLRWVTVDPKAEKYPQLSPYNYVNDNPMNNIDPNGKEIIGTDGKAVTYSVNKSGAVSWSKNASAGTQIIGNALAKSGGISDLNAYRDSKVQVTLVYSSENNATEIGHTDNSYIHGTDQVAKSTVTIYGGAIDDMASQVANGSVYGGDKGHLQTAALQLGDKDAVVAAAAGHERIHATDQTNQSQVKSNLDKGTTFDTEKAPNANETKILQNNVIKDVLKSIPLPLPAKL